MNNVAPPSVTVGVKKGVKLWETTERIASHTMFCRNFCRNVAARDDGKRGTECVSNDRSESDNVYILHIREGSF